MLGFEHWYLVKEAGILTTQSLQYSKVKMNFRCKFLIPIYFKNYWKSSWSRKWQYFQYNVKWSVRTLYETVCIFFFENETYVTLKFTNGWRSESPNLKLKLEKAYLVLEFECFYLRSFWNEHKRLFFWRIAFLEDMFAEHVFQATLWFKKISRLNKTDVSQRRKE